MRKKFFRRYSLSFFGLLIFSTAVSVAACEFMPSSKAQTIAEVVTKYQKDTGDTPKGLIYAKNVTHADMISYNSPDRVTEMRSLFPLKKFYDVYLGRFESRFTPAMVDYVDKTNVETSVLLWPKDSYLYYSYTDALPLICPSGTKINRITSPNDLYINSFYADKLLKDYERPEKDYSYLLEKKVEIPSVWYDSFYPEAGFDKVPNLYRIKGVLDTDSDLYKSFSDYIGDFFVPNEYVSYPLCSATLFDFEETEWDNRHLINTMLNVYKYEATRNNVSSTVALSGLDFRPAVIGKLETENSFKKIGVSETTYNKQINDCCDLFANRSNVLYLVEFIMIELGIILIEIILILSFKRSVKAAEQMPKNATVSALSCVIFIGGLAVSLGLGLAILAHFLPFLSIVSWRNWPSLALSLCHLIVCGGITVWLIHKKEMAASR